MYAVLLHCVFFVGCRKYLDARVCPIELRVDRVVCQPDRQKCGAVSACCGGGTNNDTNPFSVFFFYIIINNKKIYDYLLLLFSIINII